MYASMQRHVFSSRIVATFYKEKTKSQRKFFLRSANKYVDFKTTMQRKTPSLIVSSISPQFLHSLDPA